MGIQGEADAGLARLMDEYRAQHGVGLVAVGLDGHLRSGRWGGPEEMGARECRALAVAEALRWGEPTFLLAPGGLVVWAAPLMVNAEARGGLVAWVPEGVAYGPERPDLPRAATDLRQRLEAQNLTNAALLAERRREGRRQRVVAEAIQATKSEAVAALRPVWLLEEPALRAAVRRGDRQEAGEVLHRMMVALRRAAGGRVEEVRGLYLELVVSLARAAIESGGAPESLLAPSLAAAVRLAAVDDEATLAAWLRSALEAAQQAVESARRESTQAQLAEAMRYLKEHSAERLRRDEVAAVAHLSPAHFSRLVRQTYGQTFTELLTRLRLDQAADLLRQTDRPIALIALQTGFADAGYFTRVFRRHRGQTPSAYRRAGPATGDGSA